MGSQTQARIAAWQAETGIEPAVGERGESLDRMSHLACDLVRVIELERSGIRDGDGNWHGSDVLGGTMNDLIGHWNKVRQLDQFADRSEATDGAIATKKDGHGGGAVKTLTFDDDNNLVVEAYGTLVEIGTEVYCAKRGRLGRLIRVGPERGDMGGIVVWFDAPWDDKLPDGKLRAACLMNDDIWSTEGETRTIIIKPNTVITNDPCAICGARCDPSGVDFFLEGTQRLVCDRCATRIAPSLSRLKNVHGLDDECPL